MSGVKYSAARRRQVFMHKLDQAPDGCWLWLGARNGDGYGTAWNGERHLLAHRVAYEMFVGPLLPGMEIHHACETPLCVNPDHLEQLTRVEHARQGAKAQQTHCVRGHEYDADNTYVKPDGGRDCRKCIRRRARDYQRRRVAA